MTKRICPRPYTQVIDGKTLHGVNGFTGICHNDEVSIGLEEILHVLIFILILDQIGQVLSALRTVVRLGTLKLILR